MKRRRFSQRLYEKKKKNAPILVEAVKMNKSAEEMQKILHLNECPLEEKIQGRTILMHSLVNGNLEVAKLLISSGADVEALDFGNSTVLMYAATFTTDAVFIKELLRNCNNVAAKCDSDNTALLFACSSICDASGEVVKVLLNHGASVKDRNKEGNTPLILATQKGSSEVVRVLLEAGAKVEDKNKAGETALFKIKNEECLRLLLQAGANPCAVDNDYVSSLVPVVKSYQGNLLDSLTILLKAGAKADSTGVKGASLLSIVCSRRDLSEQFESVKLLLENGVNPSYKDSNGECALWHAVSARHVETVKLLLEAGANPSSELNDYKVSLLMRVCEVQWASGLDLLIEAGANVSARDKDGQTALVYALESQNEELAKSLIAAGADENIKRDATQVYPDLLESVQDLICAVNEDELSINHHINAQNAIGQNVLMMICNSDTDHIKVVEFLIKNGACLSTQYNKGKTALMYAFEKGHFSILKILIQAGAKVSTQDDLGDTLLMMACKEGNLEIVKLLLEKYVSVLIRNKNRETAVLIAASKNYLDIVCLLVERGACVVDRDKNKKSVLSYIFTNRMNDQIHPDFEQTLKNIVEYATETIMIVHEVVYVYLEIHTSANYEKLLSLFKDFIRQIVESVSSKITDFSTLAFFRSGVYDLLMYGISYPRETSHCSPYMPSTSRGYLVERLDIFYIIVQSKFKNIHWTEEVKIELGLCDLYYPAPKEAFKSPHARPDQSYVTCDTVGYLMELYDRESSPYSNRYQNDSTYEFYSTLIENLISNGYPLNSENPKVMSLLTVVIMVRPGCVYKLAELLIKRGVKICQNVLRCQFSNELKQELQVPDSLILALQSGQKDLLRMLIPYWSGPPLALLMFFPSDELIFFQNNEFHDCIDGFQEDLEDCVYVLTDVGGPLPPWSPFIEPIQESINLMPRQMFDENSNCTANYFREIPADGPPKLKNLCRHAIRGCCRSSEDLPQRLASLVPFRLKKFLSLEE